MPPQRMTPGAGNHAIVPHEQESSSRLLGRASDILSKLRQPASARQYGKEDLRREECTLRLVEAMEAASASPAGKSAGSGGNAREPAPDRVEELEAALKEAKSLGVDRDLLMRAQRQLCPLLERRKKVASMDAEVTHLTKQLGRLLMPYGYFHDDDEDDDQEEATWEIAHRTALSEQVSAQLRRALDDAACHGAGSKRVIDDAYAALDSLKKWKEQDAAQEKKVRKLLVLEDPQAIFEGLTSIHDDEPTLGISARRAYCEVDARYTELAFESKTRSWLEQELLNAEYVQDWPRLVHLVRQARLLSLPVPPNMAQMAQKFEDGENARRPPEMSSAAKKGQRRWQARKEEALESALDLLERAEDSLQLPDVLEAKKAVAAALQLKVATDAIQDMEKRIGRLETSVLPAFEAEQRLIQIMSIAAGEDIEDAVIHDTVKSSQLRAAIDDALKKNVPDILLMSAEELYERSLFAEIERRESEQHLRDVIAKEKNGNDKDIEVLGQAIQAGKRVGIATLHGEQEFLQQYSAQLRREAVEAELQEASRGLGTAGRVRLEAAIKDAKAAGVRAQKLTGAIMRLAELRNHEQRCDRLAGSLRRALPLVATEPWRVQELLESAKRLHPRTQELERLTSDAAKSLKQALASTRQRRDVHKHLASLLKTCESANFTEQSNADELIHELREAMPVAESLGVKEALINEAKNRLRSFRRERSQRAVAEQRLRLSMGQSDLGAIENALREVRALSTAAEGNIDGGDAQTKRRNLFTKNVQTSERQPSRLIDAADNMVRVLSDAENRKQVAISNLMAKISYYGPHEHGPDGVGSSNVSAGLQEHQSFEEWQKEVNDAIKHARHCGVNPFFIEQARTKIRQRRRESKEEAKALEELKDVLSKKYVDEQALKHKLARARRLCPLSSIADGSAHVPP